MTARQYMDAVKGFQMEVGFGYWSRVSSRARASEHLPLASHQASARQPCVRRCTMPCKRGPGIGRAQISGRCVAVAFPAVDPPLRAPDRRPAARPKPQYALMLQHMDDAAAHARLLATINKHRRMVSAACLLATDAVLGAQFRHMETGELQPPPQSHWARALDAIRPPLAVRQERRLVQNVLAFRGMMQVRGARRGGDVAGACCAMPARGHAAVQPRAFAGAFARTRWSATSERAVGRWCQGARHTGAPCVRPRPFNTHHARSPFNRP